ncbi:DUF4007 family protein [Cuspidothrix issatschenkoi]|jgi:hypothetical protein|uniref:DUF4007 domain-containing protein n=1 Tax=Cuspidothrix issatschenkoi CHARLIE-1 TaxID=2052836 RepID=A0A2S6CW71_9CYAN|nr:DUF4007 family protein [Cuspidothrix issatschenkoi]PPJ64008.1 hypothetical protein CUN59_07060 [Cuspidothrix issatschenkoi CHARLIE-1]
MAKMQLHFNGNFSLKKEEIKRILEAASEEKGLKDTLENLMTKTGLGNAKVGKIKSWAARAGLVKDNYLSPEGKIVLKYDPYLQSIITDWLMHFYLSFGNEGLNKIPENPAEWGGWTYFIYTFLPENNTFTKDELFQNCIPIFEEPAKVIPERFKYILRSYTESQALANCQIIQETKTDKYQTGKTKLPNYYLIGYFLAKLWERDFNKQTSVLTDDIINQKMGIVPVLAIEPEALQQHLNSIESLGIIEQRRTVSPYQIIRRWDQPIKLLEKAYGNNQ